MPDTRPSEWPPTEATPSYRLPPSARRVKELPTHLQPRERFDREGADKVEVEVLLAILLRSGARGVNVLELARRMIEEFGTLTRLAQASVAELAAFKGVGPVKAQTLKAALELARRIALESAMERPRFEQPEDVAGLLGASARVLEHEVFWTLLLDARHRLLRPPEEVTRGLLNASLVHPREVFKEAIRAAAAAVIVAHNHPSGDLTPSPDDLAITRQLVEAGRIIGIPVLDHVIVGRKQGAGVGYYSIRASGLVNFESP